MKDFKFKIQGEEYDVKVKNFEKNIAKVEVNGMIYEVEVDQKYKRSKLNTVPLASETPQRIESPQSTGGGTFSPVLSPLPGDIVSIEVKVGDVIAKGEKIIVMEAMKMENNVLAEKGGEVKAIKVAVGDTVLQGDVLIEIA